MRAAAVGADARQPDDRSQPHRGLPVEADHIVGDMVPRRHAGRGRDLRVAYAHLQVYQAQRAAG